MMAESDSYVRETLQKQAVNIDYLFQANFGGSEVEENEEYEI